VCPGRRAPSFEVVAFFERSKVPASVEDITVQTSAASTQNASGGTSGTQSGTSAGGGVTTPPTDPAASPTATPTPQAGTP
jgi:hypothetical protein